MRISIENWDTDSELLFRMGLQQDQVNDFYLIAKDNERKQYSEIFLIYSDTLKARKERQILEKDKKDIKFLQENPEAEEFIDGLFAYKDYKFGIQKSKEKNKNALIYFNAYGSVNAREIESEILKKIKIQDYINNNLILINLMVDERIKLPENETYYSETLKRTIKYTGQLNLEIQMKYFNANSQPLFLLLNTNGEVISQIGYIKDINKFEDFLKQGRK